MDVKDLEEMEDITFREVSYSDFIHTHSSFLMRAELEGVVVGLVHEAEDEKKYRVVVVCDSKELYSDYYPNNWKKAYEAYKREVRFVRNFFIQGGRKPVYYYLDKDNKVVSVIYA